MAWVAEGIKQVGSSGDKISVGEVSLRCTEDRSVTWSGFFFDPALPKAGYVILPVKSMLLNMPLILEVIPHAEDQVMRIIGRICIRERIRRGVKAESCVIELPLAK
jgi:hypothetical protein